jgi:hypothetical protein
MQKPKGKRTKPERPAWFQYLAKTAGAFPLRKTCVVGIGFDMRARELEIEFSNGYTLVIGADGASRIVQSEPDTSSE